MTTIINKQADQRLIMGDDCLGNRSFVVFVPQLSLRLLFVGTFSCEQRLLIKKRRNTRKIDMNA